MCSRLHRFARRGQSVNQQDGTPARPGAFLGSSVSQSISMRIGNFVPVELERDFVADRQDPQRVGRRKLHPPDVDVDSNSCHRPGRCRPSVQVSERNSRSACLCAG